MTRTERTLHYRLWLIIAPLLVVLFAVVITQRPQSKLQEQPAGIAQEVRP